MAENLTDWIKARALELGFDAVGICAADAVSGGREALQAMVDEGRHGSMTWMEERMEQRASPKGLWSDVRSVIALGMAYTPDHDPMENLKATGSANISVYARNRDYHDVIKKRMKALAREMVAKSAKSSNRDCELKVFVDTAPVMEKPLAEAAGLGWQGKHSNIVSREFGSWLFLGAIYTTLELETDEKHSFRCGSCTACLDICPTNAFVAPGKVDARRCISYLTIENKGPIPREFRKAIGNRIYGCDDCMAVCPWNKFAGEAREIAYHPKPEFILPPLEQFLELEDAEFRTLFSKNPVKRIGRDRFLRNVLIAVGNSGERRLSDKVQALLADPSPLVRGAAVWALGELLDKRTLTVLSRLYLVTETDEAVREEWAAILD